MSTDRGSQPPAVRMREKTLPLASRHTSMQRLPPSKEARAKCVTAAETTGCGWSDQPESSP